MSSQIRPRICFLVANWIIIVHDTLAVKHQGKPQTPVKKKDAKVGDRNLEVVVHQEDTALLRGGRTPRKSIKISLLGSSS